MDKAVESYVSLKAGTDRVVPTFGENADFVVGAMARRLTAASPALCKGKPGSLRIT